MTEVDNLQVNKDKLIDTLILARYYYKYGMSYIDDNTYDIYLGELKKIEPNHWLINTVWYNDNIPYETLAKYGIQILEDIKTENDTDSGNLSLKERYKEVIERTLDIIGSKSIETITQEEEILDYLVYTSSRNIREYLLSIKEDGICIILIYRDYKLICAKTKGRTGNCLDITERMKKVVPTTISKESCDIGGELILNKKYLPYLKNKYGKNFKTARNSISTLISSKTDISDASLLDYRAYKIYNSDIKTLEQEYSELTNLGFDVPPYKVVNIDTVQDYRDIFNEFCNMYEDLELESDGVVINVNNNEQFVALGGDKKYNYGNKALKYGAWSGKVYTSTLIDVEWSSGKRKLTPRALIEPVTVCTNATVSYVNISNPSFIVNKGLYRGCEITFKYEGNAFIRLV